MSLEGKSQDEITALAQLADSVLANPKYRTPFQRLLKASNPGISLPEVDMLDTVSAAVKPHLDKITQMDEERTVEKANNAAQNAANALYETLKDDGQVRTRAEFQTLVKYANDNGFQTAEAGLKLAASHRDNETRLTTPTPMNGAGADFSPANESFKNFFKDPKGTATATARAMIDDIKSGKLKIPANAQ